MAKLKSPTEVEAKMKVRTLEDGQNVTICRKSTVDTPRLLGCHVSVNGDWKKEVSRWTNEATRFTAKVKKAKFS